MIKYLGELMREHHHVKVKGSDKQGKARFERAIFLYKPTILGRSFWVPDSCGWKYLEPKDNHDMAEVDRGAFEEIRKHVLQQTLLNPGYRPALEYEAMALAVAMNRDSGFLLMTGYSLVRCCQLLDITICAPALAQLLMFIQDGIQDMAKMPMPQPDKEVEMGEMKLTLDRGGEVKTWDEPLTVKESELQSGILGG